MNDLRDVGIGSEGFKGLLAKVDGVGNFVLLEHAVHFMDAALGLKTGLFVGVLLLLGGFGFAGQLAKGVVVGEFAEALPGGVQRFAVALAVHKPVNALFEFILLALLLLEGDFAAREVEHFGEFELLGIFLQQGFAADDHLLKFFLSEKRAQGG